jgi:hypothetical protein
MSGKISFPGWNALLGVFENRHIRNAMRKHRRILRLAGKKNFFDQETFDEIYPTPPVTA